MALHLFLRYRKNGYPHLKNKPRKVGVNALKKFLDLICALPYIYGRFH
jgi:hypothetical protein